MRLLGLLVVAGCAAAPASSSDAECYLDDADFRGAALVGHHDERWLSCR